MLKRLELSQELHHKLFRRCAERGIEFMSTPFDIEAAAFLVSLGMKRIKVASGELTNSPFLAALSGMGLPLIVSTGMSDLAEVETAVAVLHDAHLRAGASTDLREVLTLLHCTSNYPAAIEDVNLRAMLTMAGRCGLPVGYSDHTQGIQVALSAVAIGACVIEKHFTVSRELPGPDHRASLEPAELAAMVRGIREVERSLGSPLKQPSAAELPVRALVRRSLAMRSALPAGAVLRSDDLMCLRPASGLAPGLLPQVVGQALRREVKPGQILTADDVAPCEGLA